MSERLFIMIGTLLTCWVPILCATASQNSTFVWWKPWTWEKELWVILLISLAVSALGAYSMKIPQ